jgi:hypothetical protein
MKTIDCIYGCLLIFALSIPVHGETGATTRRYFAKGADRDGFYDTLAVPTSAPALRLTMTRVRHFADIGGLRVEQNSTFKVEGKEPEGLVALDIQPEDVTSRSGPIAIQTGTIYHVKGTVGGHPANLDIHQRRKIGHVGPVAVEADTWTEIVSSGETRLSATMHRVVESRNGGGILIQTGTHYTFAGTDSGKRFELTFRDTRSGGGDDQETADETIDVKGDAPEHVVALALALRPFLRY